jgi:hypothetical protein
MSARYRTNEDLRTVIAAQRQTAAADLQQARTTGLKQTQTTTAAQSEFGQTTNPTRFAGDMGHLRPFAGTQQFERKKGIQIHGRHPIKRWEIEHPY